MSWARQGGNGPLRIDGGESLGSGSLLKAGWQGSDTDGSSL